MKAKGPYKRPSRFAAVIPMNFYYVPGRPGHRQRMFKPKPLRALFVLRDRLRTTS